MRNIPMRNFRIFLAREIEAFHDAMIPNLCEGVAALTIVGLLMLAGRGLGIW